MSQSFLTNFYNFKKKIVYTLIACVAINTGVHLYPENKVQTEFGRFWLHTSHSPSSLCPSFTLCNDDGMAYYHLIIACF